MLVFLQTPQSVRKLFFHVKGNSWYILLGIFFFISIQGQSGGEIEKKTDRQNLGDARQRQRERHRERASELCWDLSPGSRSHLNPQVRFKPQRALRPLLMPSWDILSPPLHIFVFSSLLQEAVTAGSSDDFDVVPTNSLKKKKTRRFTSKKLLKVLP